MSDYQRFLPAPTVPRNFVSYVNLNEDEESVGDEANETTRVSKVSEAEYALYAERNIQEPLSDDKARSEADISINITPIQPGFPALPALPSELHSLLTTLPFFSGASKTEEFLNDISKVMHVRKYSMGDIVIRQGETARAMFFIIKGTLKVISEDGEIDFGELSHGTFFGEIGILFDVKRTATVVAKTNCTLVTLTADEVRQELRKYDEIRQIMERAAKERYEILTKELERAGRKPVEDLQNKLFEIRKTGSLQTLRELPPMSTVSRRNSIAFGLSDYVTSEPQEPTEPSVKESSDESIDPEYPSRASVSRPNYEVPLLNIPDKYHRKSTSSRDGSSTPDSRSSYSRDDSSSMMFVPPQLSGNTRESDSLSLSSPESSDPVGLSSQALLSRRLNDKRRVSVAVWSDDKLMQFAQNVANQHASRESRMKTALTAKSEESLASSVDESGSILGSTASLEKTAFAGLDAASLAQVFRHLDFKTLMRIRRLNRAVSNLILDRMHNLTSVVDLSPWHKKIDNKVLGNVVSVFGPNIVILSLRNCWQIKDEGLIQLAQNTPKLRMLSLSSAWETTDAGLQAIAQNCKQLRAIELSNCRKITDIGVIELMNGCPYLEAISLSYCKNLTDAIMSCSNWATIQRVNFQRCTGIFDAGFAKWRDLQPAAVRGSMLALSSTSGSSQSTADTTKQPTSNLVQDPNPPKHDPGAGSNQTSDSERQDGSAPSTPRRLPILSMVKPVSQLTSVNFVLEELNLSDCSFLTDQTISLIAERCPRLQRLCLSFCCSLTESFSDALVGGCSQLDTLDMSYCGSAVTDASLLTLAVGFPVLRRLSIRGCVQVTDTGIDGLISSARSLKELNITQCKAITAEKSRLAGERYKLTNLQNFFDTEFVQSHMSSYKASMGSLPKEARQRAMTAPASGRALRITRQLTGGE